MSRFYFAFILTLFMGCKHSPARKVYDYCYSNKKGTYVATAGNPSGVRIKLSITDVKLSPDGTHLAYTDYSAPDHERRIGMMDLTTQKSVILDSACHNCYGPVWSPDGKYLAYNAMQGQQWNIKFIDIDKGTATFLTAHAGNLGNFSPVWTADSKKIIVQDMAGIYIINLNGEILRTIDMNAMDSTLLLGSSTQFFLTPKEDKLIFAGQRSTDSALANDEGEPPVHLFAYDPEAKKLTELGPKDHSTYDPVFKGDTIFCGGYALRGKGGFNIYSMDVAGGNFKLAFRGRQYFSCRIR